MTGFFGYHSVSFTVFSSMLTKILFTLTVIVGTLIFFKKQRAGQVTRSHASTRVTSENQKMFRQGAYLFLALMIFSAIAVFAYRLNSDADTMQVRVVNTQTGTSTVYLAAQKDIQAKYFTTIKGRKVYIADVERIEVEPVE